ncbi:hypothetical protein LK459_13405 [Gordonia otitidis]|uniref:Rv0361 family membrane protein n=1 Tax=Gordonia otitidis TaxID=249058 RepID=UPI001D13E1C0|nr:hypothetical protein [Gordonia otitidis]UEA57617.1 hypothetical protein LK459_13405 [Gordonia otitidis]
MAKGARESAAGDEFEGEQRPRTWKDAWPFWIALVVVALAILGVVLSNVLRPAQERASDSGQVQFAINDNYTARNNVDYGKYKESTCAADTSSPSFISGAEFVRQNRTSVESKGRIVIPEITDVTVNGERATARVHWHFDKTPDDEQTTSVVVVKDDGRWKLCTS